jgi:hypothetical protein
VSSSVFCDAKMSRLSAEAEAKQLKIVLLRHDGVVFSIDCCRTL